MRDAPELCKPEIALVECESLGVAHSYQSRLDAVAIKLCYFA